MAGPGEWNFAVAASLPGAGRSFDALTRWLRMTSKI